MPETSNSPAHRAASAARDTMTAEPRSSILVPMIAVAFAILSAVFLFLTENEGPGQPTTPMPVPHVQAPGGDGTTTPPAPRPQQ